MSVQTNIASVKKEVKTKPNLKYLRDRDRELVKGIFRFHEVPGGTMMFSIRLWKEDQVENFTLKDGDVYTIPLGVARHLNKNCWYPVHAFAKDDNGHQIQKISEKVRRCSFQSLEFTDLDDLTPVGGTGIVTVENI